MTDPRKASGRVRIIRKICIFLGITTLFSISPLQADPLEKFTWENRLLLVFALSAEDPLLQRQRQSMADRKSGIEERQMRLVEISTADTVLVDGRIDQALDASRLRRAYEVAPDRFAIILIGKDGGEKGRWTNPVRLDEVFDLIDAMPMRQEEMRSGG
jgi:hypothetical protein